jgi:hypothetical protein
VAAAARGQQLLRGGNTPAAAPEVEVAGVQQGQDRALPVAAHHLQQQQQQRQELPLCPQQQQPPTAIVHQSTLWWRRATGTPLSSCMLLLGAYLW